MVDISVIGARFARVLRAAAIVLVVVIAGRTSPAEARCGAGQFEAGNRCYPAGADVCSDGGFCRSGTHCSGSFCIHDGDIDCHNGHSCRAGLVCTADGCRDPSARPASGGSGCGSDVSGTGGPPMSRANCGSNPARIVQQRVQRQEFRRTMTSAGGGQRTNYTFSYGYSSSSARAYQEDPQVVYEKVKKECGSTPTADCAGRVINPDGLREDLKRRYYAADLKKRIAALQGPEEASIPQGGGNVSVERGGSTMAAPAAGVPPSDEQSLFCHAVLERLRSGDLGYARDELIPIECRRDQEIIAELAKIRAEHPYVTFSGPDTQNEIRKLLAPAVQGDESLEKQMPPEP
jgi:hypothetical protein